MKEGLKNIANLLWQDIINLLHLFPKVEGNLQSKLLAKKLRRDGIVKIDNFISSASADLIKTKLEDFVKEYPRSIELTNGVKLNYRNQDNPKAKDSGMLDIFFVENIIPEILDINLSQLIELLKNTTGQEVIPLRTNAYINENVTNTRVYHLDNTQPVIYKAFIYLVDVPDKGFGPYSFVKGSQRFSFYAYFNLIKNLFSKNNHSTDMYIYNKNREVIATGNKGDLIISNQNGIHRGLPQEFGKKRIALVFSFLVKSKLSYIHNAAQENINKSKTFSKRANRTMTI